MLLNTLQCPKGPPQRMMSLSVHSAGVQGTVEGRRHTTLVSKPHLALPLSSPSRPSLKTNSLKLRGAPPSVEMRGRGRTTMCCGHWARRERYRQL